VLGLLLGAAPPAARPGATIELKGLRQVRVEVEQGEGSYLLHARVLPVSAFDEATNARVVRAGREGKLYALTLSAPQAGVKRVEGHGAVPLVGEPGKPVWLDPFAASFFTRKGDYLLTLAQVASALAEDLRGASKKAGKDAPSARAFLLRAAGLEERADRCFDRVRAEVEGDRLLLEQESAEVLSELKRQREAWRQALVAAVRPYDPPEGKEK
jgi:hypothetical protein